MAEKKDKPKEIKAKTEVVAEPEKIKEPSKQPTEVPAPKPAPETQPATAPQQQTVVVAQPKKSNTWLICCGCSCGCAVVVVILIIIGWMLNFSGGIGGATQLFQDWRASTTNSATPGPK